MRCKHCNREIRKTPDGWLDGTISSVKMEPSKYQAWCEEVRPIDGEFGGRHEPDKESVILTILESIDAL